MRAIVDRCLTRTPESSRGPRPDPLLLGAIRHFDGVEWKKSAFANRGKSSKCYTPPPCMQKFVNGSRAMAIDASSAICASSTKATSPLTASL